MSETLFYKGHTCVIEYEPQTNRAGEFDGLWVGTFYGEEFIFGKTVAEAFEDFKKTAESFGCSEWRPSK